MNAKFHNQDLTLCTAESHDDAIENTEVRD